MKVKPKASPAIDLGTLQSNFTSAQRAYERSAERLETVRQDHEVNTIAVVEARSVLEAASRAILARKA